MQSNYFLRFCLFVFICAFVFIQDVFLYRLEPSSTLFVQFLGCLVCKITASYWIL